jgi:ABC-type multidrug transport system ATPase subunit
VDHVSIKIRNLTKKYRNGTLALNNIDLKIGNDAFGLLGQNGAGKTTLMRILTTLLDPTTGEIEIYGIPLKKENYDEIKKIVGYLPQELGLYPNLSVRESLDYIGGLCGLPYKIRKERIDALLESTNLTEHQRKKNRHLSGGMKRRVGLVQAMLNAPKVLIIDEPTAGLDPEEKIRIRSMLSNFGRGRTIIFSTHMIDDLAATCNSVCILSKGQIKYIGTVNQMLQEVKGHSYISVLHNENELIDLQSKYYVTGKVYNLDTINVRFVSSNLPTIGCEPVDANLEDAYIYINNLPSNNP